jgi:hypothetical protein
MITVRRVQTLFSNQSSQCRELQSLDGVDVPTATMFSIANEIATQATQPEIVMFILLLQYDSI